MKRIATAVTPAAKKPRLDAAEAQGGGDSKRGSIRASSVHWFRKGLRLHDNPALLEAIKYANQNGGSIYPIFCLDVNYYVSPKVIGVNRMSFLLNSLTDLDSSLRKIGTRLFVIRSPPLDAFNTLLKDWDIGFVSFESDIEPYARTRDAAVTKLLQDQGVPVVTFGTHTLFDPAKVLQQIKSADLMPKTYQSFLTVLRALGLPDTPVPAPTKAPTPINLFEGQFNVPSLVDIGYTDEPTMTMFKGGESEAISRMDLKLSDKNYVATFEKPNTSPASLEPSTTALSPHLKFGCLSPRTFYYALNSAVVGFPNHTQPPVSLHGQLLWREFFTMSAAFTPNFDRIEGNRLCRQIKWDQDEALVKVWEDSRTGYPWIDAAMRQLKIEGWMHHLARHCVACFLTRGDLWQSWTAGRDVFDRLLVDADWALNNANWMWLSCSAFYHQFDRVYSPIAFPKKYPESKAFIRKWVPELSKYPDKFIIEPWLAPLNIQKASGCVIGVDYPMPIVDHAKASADNKNRMSKYFSGSKA